jgi:hypothetical protein
MVILLAVIPICNFDNPNRDHREKSCGGERCERDACHGECHKMFSFLDVAPIAKHARTLISEQFPRHAVVHIADHADADGDEVADEDVV